MNIVLCSVVILVSFILTYFAKRYALNRSILDLPNDRSSHSIPTPRGGGIAIAVTWFLVIIYLFLRNEIDSTLFYALLCGLPITAIGLIDDLITISPKIRFFVQLTSAAFAVVLIGGINYINVGFIHISVPFLFSIIAIISIVWFTNLFNFLDGIDGYVSAEVIFLGLASFVLFGFLPPILLSIITAGFLIWNWQPAKIFMGDVGSTLLGFTIGIFAIYYSKNGETSIITWLILTSLFWFDATLTLFRRWRNGEKLSVAHKKHTYQRIVQFGYSHQKTVLWSIVVNIVLFGLAYLSVLFNKYSLVFLFVAVLMLFIIVKLIDKRFPFEKKLIKVNNNEVQ